MNLPSIDNFARAFILVAGLATVIYLAVVRGDGASVGLIIGAVGAAVGFFFPGKPAPHDPPPTP